MKVLFAVHDEKVSLSIVKKYQKEYKEIISYKNVYYFNAIFKELQRDKSYDRIVIDEELEEFTSSNYEQKDKFIFDKLDNITDEASNTTGSDIPIVLICTERRTKGEEFLVKLFGIGIYNAIIGNDRSTDEVCRLIYKPRTKKEAKIYYKVDADDVNYKRESEDDVGEEEIQHILLYFKKLGRNEEKYVEGFKNVVSQYNENQLKVIASVLPTSVKSILEKSSPEYQKLIEKKIVTAIKKNSDKKVEESGTTETLLTDRKPNIEKRIIVPKKINKTLISKVNISRPINSMRVEKENVEVRNEKLDEEIDEKIDKKIDEEIIKDQINIEENEAPKKKRGRPPKKAKIEEPIVAKVSKKRGRPPKNVSIEELQDFQQELPKSNYDLDDIEEQHFESDYENSQLNLNSNKESNEYQNNRSSLNLEDYQDNDDYILDEDDVSTLSDIQEYEPLIDETEFIPEKENDIEDTNSEEEILRRYDDSENQINNYAEQLPEKNNSEYHDYTEYNNLLSSTRKVMAFVGTSKNGTSFIVNNIAKILSDSGIDTAILDATKNKNAYYIYTKNEEDLRQVATKSIENLAIGNAQGIKVKSNLTVYTELPSQENIEQNVGTILETLIKNHSAVLIDCDFETPCEYFDKSQEIYLVQSMDILTIQPLTAFLRQLKSKNILNESKLRIILNKVIKLRGVSPKVIVGGMSNYNDPEMSFMTELFDRNNIVPMEIPFDMSAYGNYLEQIIECELTTDRYSKDFQNILKKLASVIYPLLPNGKKDKKKKKSKEEKKIDSYEDTAFSNSVNDTLNNMKKRY